MERMETAEAFMAKHGRLWARWEPTLGLEDEKGRPVAHPIGCLPECLALIQKMYPPDTAGLHWAHNKRPKHQGGGGAA